MKNPPRYRYGHSGNFPARDKLRTPWFDAMRSWNSAIWRVRAWASALFASARAQVVPGAGMRASQQTSFLSCKTRAASIPALARERALGADARCESAIRVGFLPGSLFKNRAKKVNALPGLGILASPLTRNARRGICCLIAGL